MDTNPSTPAPWADFPGWFDDDVARVLELGWQNWATVRSKRSELFAVEVGAFLGRTTCYLADMLSQGTPRLPPSRLFTVDTFCGSPGEGEMQERLRRLGVSQGQSFFSLFWQNVEKARMQDWVLPIIKPSVEAAKLFPENSCALVYLDAAHTFADVTADLTAWYGRVAAGGFLCGHDLRWGEVFLALKLWSLDNGLLVHHSGSCWYIRC